MTPDDRSENVLDGDGEGGVREPAPRLSIVTPSLDQDRFLEAAIESVLAQDEARFELLIMDGGSSDASLEILRAAAARDPRIRWRSEPDRGQSHAINKGMRLARAPIVAWLNADDVYAPGAFTSALAAFEQHPEAALVYGRGRILDEHGTDAGPFRGWEPLDLWRLLHGLDYVLQPATFFRRAAVEAVGWLDEALHWSMDWDLWIRLAAHGDVVVLDDELAMSREYGSTKTSTGGWRRIRELGRLARRHTGRFWTPGVRLYAADTAHRALAACPGPVLRVAPDAVVGLMGRIGRGMAVHADGWLAPCGRMVVPRRWSRVRFDFQAMCVPPDGTSVEVRVGVDTAARVDVPADGAYSCTFELPPGTTPFVTLEVVSARGFRPDPSTGDRRHLGVLRTYLGPSDSAAADDPGPSTSTSAI